MSRSRVDVVAGGQLGVHPVDALRRALQALPVGVLADLEQDLVDRGLDPAVAVVPPGALDQVARRRPASSPISVSISSTIARTWLGRLGRARHGRCDGTPNMTARTVDGLLDSRPMAHPRVEQLRFARSEWSAACAGCREETRMRRLEPMNSISWMVGHLAWHERLLFVERGQGLKVEPEPRRGRERDAGLDAVARGDVGGLDAR